MPPPLAPAAALLLTCALLAQPAPATVLPAALRADPALATALPAARLADPAPATELPAAPLGAAASRVTEPWTASPPGRPVPPEWVPPLFQVTSMRLGLALPVAPAEAPLPLHATHPEHRPAIAMILDLLVDSRLAPGDASPSPKGPVLQIALRNGPPVAVHPAADCREFSSEDGHGFTCRPSQDHVILEAGHGRAVRLHNPRMAAWLQGGWREHVPVGEPVEIDREAAIAIAREQSRLPNWQASFVEAYPVERLGGTEVRRAWLLEAELPAGQKIRLVLDARTGEVLRLVQLESLE